MHKTGMTHRKSEPAWTNGEALRRRGVQGAVLREHAQARPVPPPAAGSSSDPMDAAKEREDEAVRLAVLQRRHELEATVEEVLQSLATGQYGRCVECGQHIALARLRAMPLALRCLVCQERFERACRIAAARESQHKQTHISEWGIAL